MQLTMFEQQEASQSVSSGGKTSPASYPTKGTPSDAFLQRLLGKSASCSLQGSDGQTLVVCMDPKEQSRGGSWTPNISAWPNGAAVCSLWQVLERGSIPHRYFLSQKACAGILRRAEKRGKVLPTTLHHALSAVAEGSSEPETQEGKTLSSPSPAWHTDKGGAEVAVDRTPTLTCNHEVPIVCHGTQDPCVSDSVAFALGRNSGQENAVLSVAMRGREGGATAELGDDVAGCLRASSGGGDKPHVLAPVCFPILEVGKRTGKSTTDPRAGLGIGGDQDPMYTLQACAQHGVCVTGDITHTLKAEGFDGSEDGTGRGQPIVAMAFQERGRTDGRSLEIGGDVAYALTAPSGGARSQERNVLVGSAVRRLTPRETERLQGFPDDWTQIPWRNKPADECPDGPRYKAIGNSKAVPVVRWIARRMQQQIRRHQCP